MTYEARPNKSELEFLTLSYNRFYDIYEELIIDSFWEKDSWYRFSKIKEVFLIYAELLNYEPIMWVIEHIKNNRPPMEAEIGKELFKFIRNVVTHFPLFENWDGVWMNKGLINWEKTGGTIDSFLDKYSGREDVKYRVWDGKLKKMTYVCINFPKAYSNERIYLNDILSEKDGIKFAMVFMKNILNTQVLEIKES